MPVSRMADQQADEDRKPEANCDRFHQRKSEDDLRHQDRQDENGGKPARQFHPVAVDRIGRRDTDQQGQRRTEKGDLQAGQRGRAEGLDLEDIDEPAQCQALRREGQIGRVAEGRTHDDDQRCEQEEENAGRKGGEDRVNAPVHHTAIGLSRRAMRLMDRCVVRGRGLRGLLGHLYSPERVLPNRSSPTAT